MPANIFIKNSEFLLNKCLSNKLDKFKKSITIDSLFVKKSPLNEIILTEQLKTKLTNRLPKPNKKSRAKSFDKEELFFDYDTKVAEKDLLDKVDTQKSEQLASLVFLLRKSKEVKKFSNGKISLGQGYGKEKF